MVFFTGLSGSGKSTLARDLRDTLLERGDRKVSLLDGDLVRRLLSAGLTFSREDRDLNIARIGYVATEVARAGGIALCAPIAPYAAARAGVRSMVAEAGGFVLVHVATPLEACEARDRKGLYAKARAGVIGSFTGISDPYEEPTDADVVVDTSALSRRAAVDLLLDVPRPGRLAYEGLTVAGGPGGDSPGDSCSSSSSMSSAAAPSARRVRNSAAFASTLVSRRDRADDMTSRCRDSRT